MNILESKQSYTQYVIVYKAKVLDSFEPSTKINKNPRQHLTKAIANFLSEYLVQSKKLIFHQSVNGCAYLLFRIF